MTIKSNDFKILALDGGGAKGMYSLGALQALEDFIDDGPLYKNFDLIYGTSTGSIIGSLIALGWNIRDIKSEYKKVVPSAFSENSSTSRTQKLVEESERIFKAATFEAFKTNIGIVTTNVDFERATIFKSDIGQTYTGKASFKAGFGAQIKTAVLASCAAVPYFESVEFESETDGWVHLIDGGFVANNPSLFAIVDAVGALGLEQDKIKLISIGTGRFKEENPPVGQLAKIGKYLVDHYLPTDVFSKSLSASADATDKIVQFGFPNIKRFRLSCSDPSADFKTHLLETDVKKLDHMYALGRRNFAEVEAAFVGSWST